MKLERIHFGLENLFPDSNFMLMGVQPFYEYSDGKKTTNLLGYKYDVVEDKSYERFTVKIESKEPVITAEDLAKSKSRVFVEFDNSKGHIYRTPAGQMEISFSAETMTIIEA